jgi:hypothetical protein
LLYLQKTIIMETKNPTTIGELTPEVPPVQQPQPKLEDLISYDGRELKGYIPHGDLFVIEVPLISWTTPTGIKKSEKMYNEEKTKKLGDYLKVVAVGPECKSTKVGDKVLIRSIVNPPSFELGEFEFAHLGEHLKIGTIG